MRHEGKESWAEGYAIICIKDVGKEAALGVWFQSISFFKKPWNVHLGCKSISVAQKRGGGGDYPWRIWPCCIDNGLCNLSG